ncbi:hypothetical protein HDE_05511 [Halotydeus destructor]|nr:hypothetical protein HDE_05511 [Halotydeus destructor]
MNTRRDCSMTLYDTLNTKMSPTARSKLCSSRPFGRTGLESGKCSKQINGDHNFSSNNDIAGRDKTMVQDGSRPSQVAIGPSSSPVAEKKERSHKVSNFTIDSILSPSNYVTAGCTKF